MSQTHRITAVLLAYGDQPLLRPAVDAVLGSTGVDVDVVVVDNGGTPAVVADLERTDRVRVVRPGRNLGFAAGCNLGAREAAGELVAFVNGDALVGPGALAALARALIPGVGLTSASVRLLDAPDTINSAGNPVHFLGLSWAGGLNDPVSRHASPTDIASATGATVLARREQFLAMGGFCETLFTYVEDTDLSLRMWQRGQRVVYVPDADVRHDYEFSRNPDKFYLLERNRLFVVLTLFPAPLLVAVAPLLVLFEVAVLALAARQGWARQKVRGWRWLLSHPRAVASRRREEQAARTTSARDFARVLTARIDPGVPGFGIPAPAQWVLSVWWALARRVV